MSDKSLRDVDANRLSDREFEALSAHLRRGKPSPDDDLSVISKVEYQSEAYRLEKLETDAREIKYKTRIAELERAAGSNNG